MNTEQFILLMQVLFNEPVCDLKLDWDIPFPDWVMALIALAAIAQGFVRSWSQMLWIATQIIIVSRIEFLAVALVVPFIVGKHRTWCRRQEYGVGLALLFVRVALMFLRLGSQLQMLSPECMHTVQNIINRKSWGRLKPVARPSPRNQC